MYDDPLIQNCVLKWVESKHLKLLKRNLGEQVLNCPFTNLHSAYFKMFYYKSDHTVFSGIYSDKTLADKLMYIPNDDTQNNPFCRLQLVVEMFGHST